MRAKKIHREVLADAVDLPERFHNSGDGLPGVGAYKLPEVTGEQPCNADFGKSKVPRLPDYENGLPGVGEYILPAVTGTDACNADFGKSKVPRLPDYENGIPGVGAYVLPELEVVCGAVWGKMTKSTNRNCRHGCGDWGFLGSKINTTTADCGAYNPQRASKVLKSKVHGGSWGKAFRCLKKMKKKKKKQLHKKADKTLNFMKKMKTNMRKNCKKAGKTLNFMKKMKKNLRKKMKLKNLKRLLSLEKKSPMPDKAPDADKAPVIYMC